ncbi:polysaccharide deacetylase family protein [Umezakia ovalisporum]|uniref:Polysaccharide deacetylase family protein n=1 Tax=Umezakia ovalisporum FSS-43 TaxID=2740520 RepID=A0ABT6K1G7_9CYAN|nr:polysaccharide deacetylase family protein [Umezakia ovalisporum]MDH6055930.1 polysaccharide deacetylase family protein [Umezakia ovalisporum FSS-43]MDH6066176.1 polysaccharide deacetylase family protein [Umezakia ovalisporum APH033B]MDH6072562.1 polysaccharide deacetylase family protein [Umezakia ovalisporum CobakiLakeA]MDH6074072.1 polysaccharide deacetylase family protein [Umezakia ovalisporum CS-1034]MDH6081352.1 polysaccharide deacetylase family protein [Umezakia ovalisporum FSS-44]
MYLLRIVLIANVISAIIVYFLVNHQSTKNNTSNLTTDSPVEQKQVPRVNSPFDQVLIPNSSLDKVTSSDINFFKGKQNLQSVVKELNHLYRIPEPKQGLKIVNQVINDLGISQNLMQSIPSNSYYYLRSREYLKYTEEYRRVANAWQDFFLNRLEQQQRIESLPVSLEPVFVDLSLQNKSTFLAAMKRQSVALTFDDGPTKEYTPQILNILQKNQVKATFFVVGKRVRENCEILKMIYQSGHEIGNHSDTHPVFTKLSPIQQRQEIIKAQESINQCLGDHYPTRWFRAPYGRQNAQVLAAVHQLGLSSAQWIVDTNDWRKNSSVASITKAVGSASTPGVVLMHDGFYTNLTFIHSEESQSRQNTVQALEPIIAQLKSRGFQFVILSKAIN